MPDLAYNEQVHTASSSATSQTNALVVIPIASKFSSVQIDRPYCTIDDVKTFIKNSEFDDGFYAQAINQASRLVERITGREFRYNDFSLSPLRVDRRNISEKSIYFDSPIRSISAIKVEGATLSSTSFHFVPMTTRVDARNWLVEIEPSSDTTFIHEDTEKFKKVEVYGKFGYLSPTGSGIPTDLNFPSDVRRATTIIAGTLTGEFRREQVDETGNKITSLEFAIPKEAIHILKKNKRVFL